MKSIDCKYEWIFYNAIIYVCNRFDEATIDLDQEMESEVVQSSYDTYQFFISCISLTFLSQLTARWMDFCPN